MPATMWELSTREFVDMYDAHIDKTNEEMDREMQRTAWFTAYIMNASGNLKTQVKANKLYEPMTTKDALSEEEQRDYIEEQREQLMRQFNIE